ncbi:MAG TPA: hypothetical protein VM284_05750 [Candidatus Limnocylindria bacterium]|nr:hypothetical protein [Candidatus Limnocylindria bacterium]
MSNLVTEMLLRLIKPLLAVLLGGLVYWIATALGGAPGSVELALLSILCGAAFILLAQEGPI